MCVIFSIIIMPILVLGVMHIDAIFDIPEDLLTDAKWLFFLTIVSFLLSVVSNCVNTTLFADNYLDFINYIKITRQLSKFGVNVILFLIFDANIIYIGVANLLSEILVLLISFWAYYKKKPALIHFGISRFEKAALSTMAIMIFWVIVQRSADVFLYKVDAIFMNIYFGIEKTGIIGAISEFGSYAISLTGIFGSLIGPLLLISYSNKDYNSFKDITIKGSYVVGLICALFCGLLIGSANSILAIWLGEEYSQYGFWLVIKLVVIPYTTCGAVFTNSYLFANYNKVPAITSLVISLLNVTITFIFLSFIHSVEGFLIICLCFILIQGFFMNIYFFDKLFKGRIREIAITSLKTTLYLIAVALTTWFFISIFPISGISGLIITYVAVAILSIIILDSFFLPSDYRSFLYELIPVYKTIRGVFIKS